ncbi:uncharacterized protein LOC128882999 [Hylaeus volcanicus]|uniref:uncharacterized protein LOC128882999 n=1 Tax=Hylaeus volcanicus TaxID=313075 RepID=UPI0023B7E903|nr:uncharacterized protein LOC128882999 [Hylaeus volcanicus]
MENKPFRRETRAHHESESDDASYLKKTSHSSASCTFGRRSVLKNRHLKKLKKSKSPSPVSNDIVKKEMLQVQKQEHTPMPVKSVEKVSFVKDMLRDSRSSQIIARLDTQYIYHVAPFYVDSIKKKSNWKEKCVRRYFFRREPVNEEKQIDMTSHVVDAKIMGDAKRDCYENCTLSSLWLKLSSLECESHVKGLTPRERMNRRLDILKEGLEHCEENSLLLLEFFSILQVRDNFEQVEDYYVNFFKSKKALTCVEDDPVTTFLSTVKSKENAPCILYEYITFLCHSPRFSCSSIVQNLVTNFSTLNILNASSKKQFDKTFLMVEKEKKDSLLYNGATCFYFVFQLLYIVASASQWNLVATILQILGHWDMLLTLKNPSNCLPSLEKDVFTFWNAKTPRLGCKAATSFYLSILQTTSVWSFDSNAPSSTTPLFTPLNTLHDILEDIFEEIKAPSFNLSYTCTRDSWYAEEAHKDQLFWLFQDIDNCISQFPNAEVSLQGNLIQSDNRPFIEFLLRAVMGCSLKQLRHGLYETLGYAFLVLRHGSNFMEYQKNLCDSEIDLLFALIQGIQSRELDSFTLVQQNRKHLNGKETPILLSEALGFSLGGTSVCDLHFSSSILTRIKCFLEDSASDPDCMLLLQNDLCERFATQQLSLAYSCTLVALQMLSWCLDDSILLSAVIAFLCYTNKSSLAKKLLMLNDTSVDGWGYYILFHYISNPTLKRLTDVRLTSFRILNALQLLPDDLSFLSIILRVECLALLQTQKTFESSNYFSLRTCVSCSPRILQILCFISEGCLESWAQMDKQDDSSCHAWMPQTIPSRVRLLAAYKYFSSYVLKERNIYENSQQFVESDSTYLLPKTWYVAVLATAILQSVIETQHDAWAFVSNTFLPFHEHLAQQINTDHCFTLIHQKKFQSGISSQIEGILDIFLLSVITCAPTPQLSYSYWDFSLLQKIIHYTLNYFPHHHRCAWIATQLFRTKSTVLQLRCFLSPSLSSLKGVVISELASGFPCFRRLENIFEMASQTKQYKFNENFWNLYLCCLLFANRLRNSFFIGLPKSDSLEQLDQLNTKLSSVSQRACCYCPFSKKLWLQRIFILQMFVEEKRLHPDQFLENMEILCRTQVHCQLDPLFVITNTHI